MNTSWQAIRIPGQDGGDWERERERHIDESPANSELFGDENGGLDPLYGDEDFGQYPDTDKNNRQER